MLKLISKKIKCFMLTKKLAIFLVPLLCPWLLPFDGNLCAQSYQEVFSASIHALEKTFGGRMGLMAKNLRTGEVLAVNADEKFPTASVIKVPIMVEYFYQVAEGKISPTRHMQLTDDNKWGGSGLLQFFHGSVPVQLADAVMLMITISDNTATNLVIDALGDTHAKKLAAVNERMLRLGLKNTRLLNKLLSWETKTDAPESIRYGIGVSTPADMVLLLEKMARGELVDSTASRAMRELLMRQQFNDMIPRFLPFGHAPGLHVAHKTGAVTAVRADVGLVYSEAADFAIAIFIDQQQDRRDSPDNNAVLAAARAARMVWNYFTGDSGLTRPAITSIDWNPFPGGTWARIFLKNGLFPHPARAQGHTYQKETFPADPHYRDSSAVVVIPDGFHEVKDAVDLIIHFHGWNNDNLGVLEQFRLPQQLIRSGKNAVLVLAQGPWRAKDSHGGKMEDAGGLRRFVEEVLELLLQEKRIAHARPGQIILSAHSGGYRPALLALAHGDMQEHIAEIFLFDAFYALTENLLPWLQQSSTHKLRSIYTEHLAVAHRAFMVQLQTAGLAFSSAFSPAAQIVLTPADVCHNCVVEGTFQKWLEGSDALKSRN